VNKNHNIKAYLKGKNKDTASGECPICTILIYPPDNKPIVWPCPIMRKDVTCPYMTEKDIAELQKMEAEADALIKTIKTGLNPYDKV